MAIFYYTLLEMSKGTLRLRAGGVSPPGLKRGVLTPRPEIETRQHPLACLYLWTSGLSRFNCRVWPDAHKGRPYMLGLPPLHMKIDNPLACLIAIVHRK